MTARYIVNTALAGVRGHFSHASALARLVLAKGNPAAGLPWLVVHCPKRVLARLPRRPVSARRLGEDR